MKTHDFDWQGSNLNSGYVNKIKLWFTFLEHLKSPCDKDTVNFSKIVISLSINHALNVSETWYDVCYEWRGTT